METVEVKSHEGGIYWRDGKGRVLMQIGNLPVHEGMSVATDGKYIYGREHFGVSPYILPNKTGGGIPIYYENTQKGYFNTQTLKYERSDNREPQTTGWKRKCLVNTAESEWAFPICEEENVNHEFMYEFDADMLIGNVKGDKKYYTYQIVGDGVLYKWNTKVKSTQYSLRIDDFVTVTYSKKYTSEANPDKDYERTSSSTEFERYTYTAVEFEGNGTIVEAAGEKLPPSEYSQPVCYGIPRIVIRDTRTGEVVKETNIKFYKLAESLIEQYKVERPEVFVWDDMRLVQCAVQMRRIVNANPISYKEYPIYRLDGKTRRVGMFLTIDFTIGCSMQCSYHFAKWVETINEVSRYYDVQGAIDMQGESTTTWEYSPGGFVYRQINIGGKLNFRARMYVEAPFDEDNGSIDFTKVTIEKIWDEVVSAPEAGREIYRYKGPYVDRSVSSSSYTERYHDYPSYNYIHLKRFIVTMAVDYSEWRYSHATPWVTGKGITVERGKYERQDEKSVKYLLQDGYYASYGGYIYNNKKQLLMKFEVKDWKSINIAWVFAFCDAGNGVYIIHCDVGFIPLRASLLVFKKTKNGYEQIDGGLSLYELVECRNKKLRKFKAIKQYIGGG